MSTEGLSDRLPTPPAAGPEDVGAGVFATPTGSATGYRADGLSLVKLAEELDEATDRLAQRAPTAVKPQARNEIDECLQDLRGIGSNLRGVALCLDSVLAESPSEHKEAFRAIIRSFSEKVRDTTEAAHAVVDRMSGQMKELDALVGLGSREPVAARLQDVLVSVREVATEVGDRARSLSAEVDSAGRQLTVLERQLEEARHKALFDELTGLQNRRALEMGLASAVYEGQMRGPWCFLVVDIDHFRAVNEKHGRAVGDGLLFKVARLLELLLAGSGAESTVARYGGEEFGVLLRQAPTRSACTLAEKIREGVSSARWALRTSTDLVLCSTVSAGVTAYQPGDTPETVISRAFTALRRAKTTGRNRVVLEQSNSASLSARQAAFRGQF